MKTIHMRLNDASIDNAIRELEAYKRWLREKAKELRERVAYFIAKDASAVFNTSTLEGLIGEGAETGRVEVTVDDRGDNITVVLADGEDAYFMEFGAGVYFNGAPGTSPHPKGAELGYTIGSYGKGNGVKTVWGFNGTDGKLHLTHGTPASMPLYRACMSVAGDIVRIAREVFTS